MKISHLNREICCCCHSDHIVKNTALIVHVDQGGDKIVKEMAVW